MVTHVLRQISEELHKSTFLTIVIDETTDITKQEQVTVVMRRIDENFAVHEKFLGVYAVPRIDAKTLLISLR